jgi:hypothetical protein
LFEAFGDQNKQPLRSDVTASFTLSQGHLSVASKPFSGQAEALVISQVYFRPLLTHRHA